MCDTNAYIYNDGKEDLYLENVDALVMEGNKIHLKSLFGEEKTFDGHVKEISLRRHKILLERTQEQYGSTIKK